jgi:hypothetical protein
MNTGAVKIGFGPWSSSVKKELMQLQDEAIEQMKHEYERV